MELEIPPLGLCHPSYLINQLKIAKSVQSYFYGKIKTNFSVAHLTESIKTLLN